MDDLISRKAAVSRISDLLILELKGQRIPTWNEVYKSIGDIPSFPAVPLDKLCEWLTANRVSIPCRLCEYDDAGKCTVQNDMSKPCPNTTRDWRRVITNWMEGLDAAD